MVRMHAGEYAACMISSITLTDPSITSPDPAVALPFVGNEQDFGVADSCAYLYSDEATPVVTSFSQQVVALGASITVTGENLDHEGLRVSFL